MKELLLALLTLPITLGLILITIVYGYGIVPRSVGVIVATFFGHIVLGAVCRKVLSRD